jgi:putative peptidoglycan lipid II flippase
VTDMEADAKLLEDGAAGTSAAGIARAGLVISASYLAARILGYVQVVVLGTTFGAGPDLDAFFAAFRIPDLIFQLVAAGAVASALVPMVAGLRATGESARAWRIVSTIANLMLIGLAILAVAAFVVAPILVPAITPGFDGPQLEKTIELTRLMLLAPILLSLGAVATAALNGSRRFVASALAPIVYNIAIISGALVLGPSLGVTGVAIGVVAGSAGHLLVQLGPLVRAGFRYAPRIDLGDAQAREALVLMGPRVVGLGVTQLTFVVMTSLASGLGQGAITAYTIAFSLLQIPLGVIGIPLGIVIFPSLAQELALGRTGTYLALVSRAVRVLVFVMLPLAALGMVLRRQVVELLLGYGRFDVAAVTLTAETLLLFLIGLAAHAMIGVLARAFYARRDTRTPVLAAILAVVVNTSVAILLVGSLGLPAVGLGIAAGAWSEAIVLLWLLRRREPAFDVAGIAGVTVRCAVGAVVAAGAALLVLQLLGPGGGDKVTVLVQAVAATIAGGLAYLVVAAVLRIPELATIVDAGRALLRRGRPR